MTDKTDGALTDEQKAEREERLERGGEKAEKQEVKDAKQGRKRGVSAVVREALLAGKSNEEALAAVRAEFPESKTTLATISWYRNDLRKDPANNVPRARDVKKADAAPAADEAPAAPGGESDPLA